MTDRRSSARICRENDWKAGDVLEGWDGGYLRRIRLTAIGDAAILARLIVHDGQPMTGRAEGSTWDLSVGGWDKVT